MRSVLLVLILILGSLPVSAEDIEFVAREGGIYYEPVIVHLGRPAWYELPAESELRPPNYNPSVDPELSAVLDPIFRLHVSAWGSAVQRRPQLLSRSFLERLKTQFDWCLAKSDLRSAALFALLADEIGRTQVKSLRLGLRINIETGDNIILIDRLDKSIISFPTAHSLPVRSVVPEIE